MNAALVSGSAGALGCRAVSRRIRTDRDGDMMEETKITAHLPNLDVEIARRELPEANAETITLRMTAVPSFQAFADHLARQGSLPFMMTPCGGATAPMPRPCSTPSKKTLPCASR